jgi:hypothetical protein
VPVALRWRCMRSSKRDVRPVPIPRPLADGPEPMPLADGPELIPLALPPRESSIEVEVTPCMAISCVPIGNISLHTSNTTGNGAFGRQSFTCTCTAAVHYKDTAECETVTHHHHGPGTPQVRNDDASLFHIPLYLCNVLLNVKQ